LPVPSHRFTFTVAATTEGPFDEMLADLAASVLNYLGFGPAAIADTLRELRIIVATVGARGCEAQFVADGRELQIAVVPTAGREQRLVRPLPQAEPGALR
jgi:hypothetical protein